MTVELAGFLQLLLVTDLGALIDIEDVPLTTAGGSAVATVTFLATDLSEGDGYHLVINGAADDNPTELGEYLDYCISAEVVDLRCLRPFDRDTVTASVEKTHRAVVIDEGWMTGAFGAEVASSIMTDAFDDLDAPVARVAGKEVPIPYNRELEQFAIPGPQDVIEAAKALF